jgi:predicted nucleic acid-binding protein
MRRVVPDASALALVVFGDRGGAEVSRQLQGAALFAPPLLRYELQSAARKECRRHPERTRATLDALDRVLDPLCGITWMDPDPVDVVLIANATGLSTYDASYLWLAGYLEADLVTRDRALSAALDPFSGAAGNLASTD